VVLVYTRIAVVLVSGIGPGFSPDINASKNFGLQPPGYALYRLPKPQIGGIRPSF